MCGPGFLPLGGGLVETRGLRPRALIPGFRLALSWLVLNHGSVLLPAVVSCKLGKFAFLYKLVALTVTQKQGVAVSNFYFLKKYNRYLLHLKSFPYLISTNTEHTKTWP